MPQIVLMTRASTFGGPSHNSNSGPEAIVEDCYMGTPELLLYTSPEYLCSQLKVSLGKCLAFTVSLKMPFVVPKCSIQGATAF
eukprot:4631759-Amphidinium_carterae.2